MALAEWLSASAVCPFCTKPISEDDTNHCNECHNLNEYTDLLSKETADTATTTGGGGPGGVTAGTSSSSHGTARLRGLVSQNKVRFQRDGFDLDLTYITDNIVAMGFPSSGTESYFRNPVEEVEKFFERFHSGHYKVYNLCSERQYDTPSRFKGSFARFPFDDHNAPCPISIIPDFVRDAEGFLKQNDSNVVAVHCKAGKGRTGVMVCCLLMALMPVELRTADSALSYFNEVRTRDAQGVTIPSQQRYIKYWERILHEFGGKVPETREIVLMKVMIVSSVRAAKGASCDPYFVVSENNATNDKKYTFKVTSGDPDTSQPLGFIADFSAEPLTLTGDVKFLFYHRNSVLSDEHLFHCWLNTTLTDLDITLNKSQLDKACKDSKHQTIHKDVKVMFQFADKASWLKAKGAAGGASKPSSSLGSILEKSKGIFQRK